MTRSAHDSTVRVIVAGLVLLALVALLILGAVALLEVTAEPVVVGALVTALGTAVGAVASLLSQTGRQSVEVANTPANPVPVDPDAGT